MLFAATSLCIIIAIVPCADQGVKVFWAQLLKLALEFPIKAAIIGLLAFLSLSTNFFEIDRDVIREPFALIGGRRSVFHPQLISQ